MTEQSITYGSEVKITKGDNTVKIYPALFFEDKYEKETLYTLASTLQSEKWESSELIEEFPHSVICKFFTIIELRDHTLSGEYSQMTGGIPEIHATAKLTTGKREDFYVVQPNLEADGLTYIVFKTKRGEFNFNEELIGQPIFMNGDKAPCAVIVAYCETHKYVYTLSAQHIFQALEQANNSPFSIREPKSKSLSTAEVNKQIGFDLLCNETKSNFGILLGMTPKGEVRDE